MKLFSSQFFKRHHFKNHYVCVHLKQGPTRNNYVAQFKKKFIFAYSDNTRNDLQIRITRLIEFILKNNLWLNHWTRSMCLHEKTEEKILCKCIFKLG
jgi:hypothetical protein